MQKRTAIIVLIIVAALALGWAAYSRLAPSQSLEPVRAQMSWAFVSLGVEPETFVPKTEVALVVAGVQVPVGVYDGNCFVVEDSEWPLMPNQVTGAICYWAGGGKEVGVFQERGGLVLKEGDVEEGTAEEEGSRGNYRPLTNVLPQ